MSWRQSLGKEALIMPWAATLFALLLLCSLLCLGALSLLALAIKGIQLYELIQDGV